MSQLRNLQSLDLSYNNFSGVIPSSITQLVSLRILSLSANHLSGAIPLGVGSLLIVDVLHPARAIFIAFIQRAPHNVAI